MKNFICRVERNFIFYDKYSFENDKKELEFFYENVLTGEKIKKLPEEKKLNGHEIFKRIKKNYNNLL